MKTNLWHLCCYIVLPSSTLLQPYVPHCGKVDSIFLILTLNISSGLSMIHFGKQIVFDMYTAPQCFCLILCKRKLEKVIRSLYAAGDVLRAKIIS